MFPDVVGMDRFEQSSENSTVKFQLFKLNYPTVEVVSTVPLGAHLLSGGRETYCTLSSHIQIHFFSDQNSAPQKHKEVEIIIT